MAAGYKLSECTCPNLSGFFGNCRCFAILILANCGMFRPFGAKANVAPSLRDMREPSRNQRKT